MTAPDDVDGVVYLEWLRSQPCIILKQRTGAWLNEAQRYVVVQASHVRVRKWGHLDNAVPLDYLLHHEEHQHGIETFQAKYQVDLAALAREHTERWRRERKEYEW